VQEAGPVEQAERRDRRDHLAEHAGHDLGGVAFVIERQVEEVR